MKRTRKSKSRPKKKAEPGPGDGLLEIFIDELTPSDACVNFKVPSVIFKADIQKFAVSPLSSNRHYLAHSMGGRTVGNI